MTKYDIVNPMQCNRVVHDTKNKQIMIPKLGGKVDGVDLPDAEAKRLIDLTKKLGEGKEILLTKSVDQSGAVDQTQNDSADQAKVKNK